MEITNLEKNGDIASATPDAVPEQTAVLSPPQQPQKRGRGKRLRNKDVSKEEENATITNGGDGMLCVENHTDLPAAVPEQNGSSPKPDGTDINNEKESENDKIDNIQHVSHRNGDTTMNGNDANAPDVDVDADVDVETVDPPAPSMSAPLFAQNQLQQLDQLPAKRVRHPNPYIQALPPRRRNKKTVSNAQVPQISQQSETLPPVTDVPQTPSELPTQPQSLQSQMSSSAAPKRVLPTRHRRGGPGVGNCNIDLLILDTEKRAKESKSVVPPDSKFFLSTNVHLIPSLPSPEGGESSTAVSTSYFDKPEVKAAYLAQKAIQVPEYWPLPDDAVGGRLRARQEEEGYETSDMAYVNRHKKYEAFEKRQRRREKEKLVHEQYKLKERIEQLKGMDVSAFGPGGEARRKEMLDIAVGLESRYAILLPPEPKKIIYKKGDKRRGKSESARAGTVTGGEEGDSEGEYVQGTRAISQPSLPPPEKTRSERGRRTEEQAEEHEDKVEIKPRRPTTPAEPRTQAITVALQATVVPNEMRKSFPALTRRGRTSVMAAVSAPVSIPTPETTPVASLVPLASTSTAAQSALPETPSEGSPDPIDAWSVPPPKKRQRVESSPRSTPELPSFTQSVLLQIAARKAAQPTARQTGRSLTAFGFRVPPEVEEVTPTYVLPDWLITLEELEQHHAERQQQRLLQQQQG